MNSPVQGNPSGCGKGCGSCSCGSSSGDCLYLTQEELSVLRQLEVLPFLPAAFNRKGRHPICLDCPGDREAVSDALTGLEAKGLISLDPDLPLQGFAYQAYEDEGAFPLHGSFALTARGQEVVELLAIQGADDAS